MKAILVTMMETLATVLFPVKRMVHSDRGGKI
jgi:hypothetical protein